MLSFSMLSFSMLSCGIEDYPYIYSIPTGYIQNELNSRVRVYISDDNDGNIFFSNYTIFYRIYVSDVEIISPSSENDYRAINTALNNDHLRVRPYIGNDSMGSSAIVSLFGNMNYYTITVQSADIDYVLSSENPLNIFGKYLIIDFSRESENETIPFMTIGNSPRYNLLRSDGGGVYAVKPTNIRYFQNSAELFDVANIEDPSVNGDITDKPSAFERSHTYVNMYIVASGLDPQTYIQLYSSPAHIGVLRLPEPY